MNLNLAFHEYVGIRLIRKNRDGSSDTSYLPLYGAERTEKFVASFVSAFSRDKWTHWQLIARRSLSYNCSRQFLFL
jgi:hypothetical protein